MIDLKQAAFATMLVASPLVTSAAYGQTNTLVIDVTGAQSWGEAGDDRNTWRNYFIGANAHITHFSYNVTITANSPSYLNQAAFAMVTSARNYSYFWLTGEQRSGTGSYAWSYNLIDMGLDLNLEADGRLYTEFYELVANGAGPDTTWDRGTITIGYDLPSVSGVPEPATWAMMIVGFGAIGGAMRRRTKAALRFAAGTN